MNRASLRRALTLSAVVAAGLMLAGCYGEDSYELPTRAMKALSPQMVSLLEQKHMPKDSPILVRIFKEESELEVWKQDETGRFQILRVYPICRWSGDLGPKVHEGDRQAPEGFYTITPALMQPNSNYYLAINTGFPNAYDRANDRRGAFLMIHGDCSSRGCYAMTDEQIGEIYSLARESFLGGQQSFQIQAYPFRMTPANLARHRTNSNIAFWRMIKEGNDHFEVSHLEPKVDVCNKHYVFDAAPPPNSSKPLTFNPTGHCPQFVVAPDIAGPAHAKEVADNAEYASLVKENVAVAPVHSGLDGGMNRVFLAQVGGNIPPARVQPPDALPQQPPPVTTADGSGQPSLASRLFGGLFGGNAATQVAATDTSTKERSAEAAKPKPARGETAVANAKPRTGEKTAEKTAEKPARPPAAEPAKPAPQMAVAKPKPDAQQQEANAAPPLSGSVMKGAQPPVGGGSFDSRWSALQ
ncbi:MAG TPA: L,D-transpeptidase family protein [Xanthobacteraceae bacterium]|nr:L,D-transpeptidase family protein [Xanthobacteraceae bacterium]